MRPLVYSSHDDHGRNLGLPIDLLLGRLEEEPNQLATDYADGIGVSPRICASTTKLHKLSDKRVI